MTFGQYFKKLRIRKKLTLRAFCTLYGYDPGNISRLERDRKKAPRSPEKIQHFAKALGLQETSEEYATFFDLAAMSNKSFPITRIKNEELLQKLPLLFRSLDNHQLTEEKLEKIIKIISQS